LRKVPAAHTVPAAGASEVREFFVQIAGNAVSLGIAGDGGQ
jgi:hypothetical protein